MKKVLMLTVIAACAIQAQAATTYTVYQKGCPWPTTEGTAIKTSDLEYFSVYGMSAAEVNALTGLDLKGGSLASTAAAAQTAAKTAGAALTTWIENNFSKAYAAWSKAISINDNPHLGSAPGGSGSSYQISSYTTDETAADSWEDLQYVVDFYIGEGDGYKLEEGQAAFRVAVLGQQTTAIHGVTPPVGWNAWVTVDDIEPIPEPTSGLLMLLGVAGLCLRRKRC